MPHARTTSSALLDRVAELGVGRLSDDRLAEVDALRERTEQRLARGDGLTVVAFVGGTGVGKSALVNRVVGAPVVREGIRRPTTDRPVAVHRTLDPPTVRLLDWFGIPDRHRTDAVPDEGLIVVDLPDHDSVAAEHRAIAARLAARVDALVVVVDPLKYARADLHDGPLAALVAHASLVTVAMNRTDELAPGDADRCVADLAARLASTGHGDIEVVPTSAATGDGVEELRARLTAIAATRTAAVRRLDADAARLALDLEVELPERLEVDTDADALAGPLLDLTGGERRCAAAELAYLGVAHRVTRSYASRIARRVAGAGRALTRDRDAPRPRRADDTVHRPPGGAVAPALATLLGHGCGLERTTAATHTRLAALVDEHAARMAPHLTTVVDAQDPRPTHRAWWSAASLGNTLTEATALIGLVWLVLVQLAGRLALPEVPAPHVTDTLSLPAALLLGGLALRLLSGGAIRWLRRIGARRHRGSLRQRIVAGQREVLDRWLDEVREQQRGDVELRRVLRQLVDAADDAGRSAALP